MPTFECVIHDGHLVLPDRVAQADLGFVDGRIAAIALDLRHDAKTTVDATGYHVFPGVIDAHVHFNEPGRTGWEGWDTGSRAFAAGGGTLCFDMPLNAHPPTVDAASFDAKLSAATGQAWTDFALWGGLVPGNEPAMAELAARGVIGFKAFMSRSGTDDFVAADDLTLYEGMSEAARLGRIVAVHAESDTITAALAARTVANGQVSARDYLTSRPAIAEVEAIGRAILLAEETGCALHIVHVSTGRGVALIAAARARGVDVTGETCAHYLLFTEDDVERLGAIAKCAPPLRPPAEQAALWAAIDNGDLPMVTSDHSPAPASMKTGDDFFQIWGGIAGVQSTLPALLTGGYHLRGMALPALSDLVGGAVAQRFGLARKGSLAVGNDADCCLVALNEAWTVTTDELLDRHRLSAYVGQALRGRVHLTFLRGNAVYRDGAVAGAPRGQLIRPADPA